MKFLNKHSDFEYTIKLNVKTNSKTQKISYDDEFLTVYLKSKPFQNKANIELIKLLKNKLNLVSNQIQIIAGSKSHKKVVKIIFSTNLKEKEIIRNLLN
jgi:uncharacterized protein (TIGR00251 family)